METAKLILAVTFCVLFAVASIVLAIKWLLARSELKRQIADANAFRRASEEARRRLESRLSQLQSWAVVGDAETQAMQARLEAQAILSNARDAAAQLRQKTNEELASAQIEIEQTRSISASIIKSAEQSAREIAGTAYDVARNAKRYEQIAIAMQNRVEGYGDEYLLPTSGLLDQLSQEMGHREAGQQLKVAQLLTKNLIKNGRAACCDYAESARRETAENFVLDAFNGRVDSILARVKHNNYGKLAQEIRDAYTLINHNGRAFREARVSEEYLFARLEELRWASVAHELRRQEAEEQRTLREQIREEEKARRDIDRALKEAAKEEDIIKRAMAKAQSQIEAASMEQRARYEAQLAELGEQLKAAEEKNQRALSMAQQTKRGHVYIISNVGSFGDDVFKIGLTRRLDPMDRIWELSDASVPFDFDVHAIILAEDAPALERQLHKHFLINQINKVNHRKEFFRANLSDLRAQLEQLGVQAKWTMTAEAREYRETQAIENAIESDPTARERWLLRQLTLDPLDVPDRADVADEAAPVKLTMGRGKAARSSGADESDLAETDPQEA